MNSTYDIALKYYIAGLWSDKRLDALVEAGKLTKTDVKNIKKEAKGK